MVVALRLTMRLSCSGVGGGFAEADVALVDLLGGVLGLSVSAIVLCVIWDGISLLIVLIGVQRRLTRLSKCGADRKSTRLNSSHWE